MNIKSTLVLAAGWRYRVPAHPTRWRCAVAAWLALTTAGMAAALAADVPAGAATQAAAKPQNVFAIGANVLFDPATQGPLLQVAAPAYGSLGPANVPPDRATLAAHVERYGLRVVPVDSLTVLAPASMCVIETNPGKPDPYSGLRAEERIKVLLSLLNADQWRKAGSADGIGAGDLNEQQRGLFFGLLPDKVIVQQARLTPGDQPNSTHYDYQGEAKSFGPAEVHLRFVRKVQFGFMKPGSEDMTAMSGPSPQVGDEITVLQSRQVRGDVVERGAVTAFGVPVMTVVPSRLKPGQLDFSAPALRVSIPIDDSARTLGELLTLVSRATGMDLVADRRLTRYPVAWRAVPGQSVRAGDILKALCWSVTGAFRRLPQPGGVPIYLLTDDVEGIGARMARLDDWAEAANTARYEALHNLTEATAKNDPLSHIQFAPNDPLALPPALQQRVDAAYRAESGPGPTFMLSDLPPALQESAEHWMEYWNDNKTAVQRDRLKIDTALKVEYKLPGDMAVEAPFSENIHFQYLQGLAKGPTKTPTARANPAPAPSPVWPSNLKRRVVLVPLPEQSAAAAELLGIVKGAGFSEVWLHVMLNDPTASARLSRAVAVGRKLGLAVGGAVSVLHNGGMPGPEDINILGETGAQFAARKSAANPSMADYYRRMGGWCLFEPQRAIRLLIPLARVPGLSALTLRATAAPGWAGESPGGDGIAYGGHMGYSLPNRLACLRELGFDPIDVAPYSYSLGVSVDLPMFNNNGRGVTSPNSPALDCWKELCDYRLRENSRGLATIYPALQQVAPDLPLYLNDRSSGYTDPNTSWYSLWDGAARIPVNPVYAPDSGGREAAFATSREPLYNRYGWNGDPVSLARALNRAAQSAAKNWRGLTLDLVGLKPVDALRMLSGLQSLNARSATTP